jgi:hypothetical protein
MTSTRGEEWDRQNLEEARATMAEEAEKETPLEVLRRIKRENAVAGGAVQAYADRTVGYVEFLEAKVAADEGVEDLRVAFYEGWWMYEDAGELPYWYHSG